MNALGFLIGVVGGAVGYQIATRVGARNADPRPIIRLALSAKHDVPATSLDDVTEAARAAALRVVPKAHGFDVLSQPPTARDRVVSVRVPDPARVTASTLELSYDGSYPDVFPVVLALASVFGPLTVIIDDAQVLVDGEQDEHALVNAHAKWIRARARARMERVNA